MVVVGLLQVELFFSILKDCSPWEGLTLQEFIKDHLPLEGPHAGAGEEHEEEGAA